MDHVEAEIKPPKNPLTVKINMAILDYYFQWFAKKYLPAFKPVITSGYRTEKKIKELCGAQNSDHLHGLAYDIVLHYPDDHLVPKAQSKVVFDEYIAPNWHGYALWEDDHIHLNLSRKVTEYAAMMGMAVMGVIGYHVIHKMLAGGENK